MELDVNPKLSLVMSILVSAWTIYEFLAPGEAMNRWVIALNCFILLGAAMGAVGAVMELSKGK